MAQITRRKWSELLTEAILAGGGHVYTSFSTRMQHWLTEGYYDLCALYHHYAFDARAVLTPPSGSSQVTLPSDCYIVVGVGVLDANGRTVSFLKAENAKLLLGKFRPAQVIPTSYARISRDIIFETLTPAGLKLELVYYRFPLAPDFAASSGATAYPETDWLWDKHVMDSALACSKRRIWRPDLAGLDAQPLGEWLDEQVQGQTRKVPVTSQPDSRVANINLGDKQ